MNLLDSLKDKCHSILRIVRTRYYFFREEKKITKLELPYLLLEKYYLRRLVHGPLLNYDSSAYYEPLATYLKTAIADYQDPSPFSGLVNALKAISDRQAGAAIAAALASAFLAQQKYAEAKTLCEIAMGFNQVDLFPQRLSATVEEETDGKADELSAYLKTSFCPVPFEHFETSPSGEVYACCPAWLPKPIGTLEDSNWEAIWRSNEAKEIRESILDGSFKYCSAKFCNLIAARTLRSRAEFTDEQLARYQEQGPTSAVFSHDLSCNLSCPSCRKEQIAVGKSEQSKFGELTQKTLIPVMESCEEVKITGSGDPFGSIHFRNLLADYCTTHAGPRKIHLHTNAVLFDEKTWNSLKLEGNVKDVIVSVDATKEETYNIVRRGGDFTRLMKNLEFLGKLRTEGRFNRLVLVCVVQKLNYREIPDFVRMAKRFHADKAEFWQLRNWGTYPIAEFLDHAVSYSSHPEYPALLEILRDPVLDDPIVSLNDLTASSQA